jgi:protein-tyrosine-phosphatase
MFRSALQDSDESEAWIVDSAGTWTVSGLPVLPAVAVIARQYNLDLTQHRSKEVTGKMLSAHDLILVMTAGHREALLHEFAAQGEHIHLLSQVAEGRAYDIPDPIDSMEGMLAVGSNLHRLIQDGKDQICNLALQLKQKRN